MMDLSPAKRDILEALLLHEKPVKAAHIAKEMEKEFPATQMHLIGLTKMGYTESPQKGHYVLSDKGKKVLGIAQMTEKEEQAILSPISSDKAFHFYAGFGKPLNLYAHDLQEFCDRAREVMQDSIDFHMDRGDFEAWFQALGDEELAKKIVVLKSRKISGDELRMRLCHIVKDRRLTLSSKVSKNKDT
jgi:DNA-binding transcriptional ArsR family regulator